MVSLDKFSEIEDFVEKRDPAVIGCVVDSNIGCGVVSLESVWFGNVLVFVSLGELGIVSDNFAFEGFHFRF